MKKAFTLIELMVSIAILAIIMSFAGAIFRFAIDSQRVAMANAEIMRKMRAITDQLNSDFAGLRKDGEIFVVWSASHVDPVNPDTGPDYDGDQYVRFDRIMFFADGDFQSYQSYGVPPTVVRGNLARICYMVANRPPAAFGVGDPIRPPAQRPAQRILARTQHILTADPTLADFWAKLTGTNQEWFTWNNRLEYDKTASLDLWKNIPWVMDPAAAQEPNKANMLAVITDVRVANARLSEKIRGAMVDRNDPGSIHMVFCEGVGEFKIQGWHDGLRRWVPEVDPDGDGKLGDSDFILLDPADPAPVLHPVDVPGVLYPYPPNGALKLSDAWRAFPRRWLDEAHFNMIPGLGRALKFTFTLYDSKGIIKEGRTFTHIVYLDR